ncbi:MAG: T9SS type A sorting domain-containing protein [Paludibacteraceae bacterium]|nr:T9SS type A sorting domain-containing protein [Paludibacteraceae bacterium]
MSVKNVINSLLWGTVFCLLQPVMAQDPAAIIVPYSMSFEDEEVEELSHWVLNPGETSALKDRWVIGNATHSDGRKSAYISANGGADAGFAVTTNVQYMYRDFVLPQGQYDCTFDFRCIGAPDAVISAGVGPASSLSLEGGSTTSIPENMLTYVQNGIYRANGVSKWKNVSFQFSSNGNRVLRLFFVWQNANRDSTMSAIGACIDNIQITTRECSKPRNITAETKNDSVIVHWEGSSEEYVLEYRKYGRDKWQVQSGITAKQYVLEGLEEGAYDIRVRGVCNGTNYSAYTYLNTFAIYYPDRHCIDYVHLAGNPNVTATYGTVSNPYANTGVEDYGSEDKLSRHVVNWEPDITDPRTRGKLRIVPDGALASVRLGNWGVSAQAESLSFEYVVDAESAAILLVRYAVVLEDPQHNHDQQPRFTLEIIGEDGDLISPDCGFADFYADATREGWHTEGAGYNMVTWKDWTTIGLNLEDRDGERLTVRLTTYDCSQGGHFGYAYFTLDCAAARITGTSCGDDAQMSIAAPDGFDYEWFDKYDNPVPDSMKTANGQTLLIAPTDTTTYRCHLSYKEEASCGFDLYSSARPRFPIASFGWEYAPAECRNRVKFTNKSHIMTKFNNVVEYHYDQPCDEYEWDFGNGQIGADRNPIVVYPNEGGRFPVTLIASIAEGRCYKDTTIYIDIPAIGDVEQVIDSAICDQTYIKFGRYYAGVEGTYTDSLKTVAGCDSIVSLRLKVNPVSDDYVGDTVICAEEPLVIDGQTYKLRESGEFHINYKNRFNCDSSLYYNVTMLDSILPEVTVREMTDTPNSGAIFISGTGFDYYTVNGGPRQTKDSIVGLNGGSYELEFFNSLGCSVLRHADVSVCMPGWVYQRWNDVLSLKNAGALETDSMAHQFVDYQWYKDNEPIPGANLSYLYVSEGLDPEAFYHLEMRRITNNEKVVTCPFTPQIAEEEAVVYVYPSPVRSGDALTVKVSEPASLQMVNMFGEVVLTQSLAKGENSVTMSVPAGVYIVQVTMGTQTRVCRISVIE